MNTKRDLIDCEPEGKRFRSLNKVLYGLPCAQCRAYYSADLLSCPVCQCGERVPAVMAGAGITFK